MAALPGRPLHSGCRSVSEACAATRWRLAWRPQAPLSSSEVAAEAEDILLPPRPICPPIISSRGGQGCPVWATVTRRLSLSE